MYFDLPLCGAGLSMKWAIRAMVRWAPYAPPDNHPDTVLWLALSLGKIHESNLSVVGQQIMFLATSEGTNQLMCQRSSLAKRRCNRNRGKLSSS